MTQSFKFSCLIFGSFLLVVCTASGPAELHKEPNIELIQDMMESPALKAQDFDTFDRTKQGARVHQQKQPGCYESFGSLARAQPLFQKNSPQRCENNDRSHM